MFMPSHCTIHWIIRVHIRKLERAALDKRYTHCKCSKNCTSHLAKTEAVIETFASDISSSGSLSYITSFSTQSSSFHSSESKSNSSSLPSGSDSEDWSDTFISALLRHPEIAGSEKKISTLIQWMIVVHQPTADWVYLQQCVIEAYAWKTAIYRLIPENTSVSLLPSTAQTLNMEVNLHLTPKVYFVY